jgi:hypothetical protein
MCVCRRGGCGVGGGVGRPAGLACSCRSAPATALPAQAQPRAGERACGSDTNDAPGRPTISAARNALATTSEMHSGLCTSAQNLLTGAMMAVLSRPWGVGSWGRAGWGRGRGWGHRGRGGGGGGGARAGRGSA